MYRVWLEAKADQLDLVVMSNTAFSYHACFRENIRSPTLVIAYFLAVAFGGSMFVLHSPRPENTSGGQAARGL